MTDQDVIELYRTLLARAPENGDTIAAFKACYGTVERGRRAILTSQEFRDHYALCTGRVLDGGEHVAASLALALLAGPSAGAKPAEPPADPARAAAISRFFETLQRAICAVAVGSPAGLRLDDLAPFGGPESALLHVVPGAAPALTLAQLADGTSVFHLDRTPHEVAALLGATGRVIDALYLLDATAGAHWVDALRGHFAPQTLLVIGPSQPGFDPPSLVATIRAAHHTEPPLLLGGLTLLQVGGWMLPVTYAAPAAPPPPPVRGAYPALAIATIVRNEAVCVANMLASVQPVASFYAVLDTGSLDATPAIAQDFLATCGVPSAFAQRDHTTFDDDFAAMRNAALAMVPDWIAWVLMLDADEELVAEDWTGLLTLIAEAGADGTDAFALPRYNFAGADKSGGMLIYPDRQVRLLRHTPERRVRYAGAVHETVAGTAHAGLMLDASAIGLGRGGPHIHHLVRRFRTPEEEERKQAFYRAIASRRAGGQ